MKEYDKQVIFLNALNEFKAYLNINKETIEEKIKKTVEKLNKPLLDKDSFKEKLLKYKNLLNLKEETTNKRHIRILLYNILDKTTITHDGNVDINIRLFS